MLGYFLSEYLKQLNEEIIKDARRRRTGEREEEKMRNTSGNRRWLQLSLITVCLVVFLLSAGDVRAGKVTYVYDAVNRLTRAIYDQSTFTYSYDKTGNRLTKTVTPTKPYGTIDFDGDGKNDIAVFRSGTGVWYIIPSGGGAPYGVGWGGDPSDIPVTSNLSSIY